MAEAGCAAAKSGNVQLLLAELKACSRTHDLRRGRQLHAEAVEHGLDSDAYVATSLIHMYAKCENMMYARQAFDRMKNPNVVPWTSLILGYAENGERPTALQLFTRMRSEGPAPNSVTFLAALTACTSLASNGVTGKGIHNLAVEHGCDSDIHVASSLIDMYAKCGSMGEAYLVFESMTHRNVVSWNSLILGYAENGQGVTALDLFIGMKDEGPAADIVTFVAALKACISLAVVGSIEGAECKKQGKEIYNLAVENGCDLDIRVFKLQNTLIDMFSKCSSMPDARKVFESMKHRDAVAWTTLILGYVENGQGLTALELFARMKIRRLVPNHVTFMAALKACTLVGGLEFGRKVHLEITDLNAALVTCLVDFYAKCGSLVEAQRVFELHTESRNVRTWTALLAGFSACGDHETVFRLFERMQDAGLPLDSVSFLCILTCCSHAGLVEKGRECFDAMSTKHGLVPSVEHCNCMVDIFGRANKLHEAMGLLQSMACSPDDVTWRTILSACRRWKNVDIGRLAFQSLVVVTAKDPTCYVLMGDIYGSRGMLQEQEMVMAMNSKASTTEQNAQK